MLSKGHNHIIAGVGDSLSVLLQAVFQKSHGWWFSVSLVYLYYR